MAVYSIARRTTNVTAGQANLEIIAQSSRRPKIMEAEIFLAAATAGSYGIGRPAAAGITPTSPVALLLEGADTAGAGVTTTALAWGTSPTAPTDFFRRIAFPATIGTGVIWTFPQGIWIAASATLTYHNIATPAVLDVTVVSDE